MNCRDGEIEVETSRWTSSSLKAGVQLLRAFSLLMSTGSTSLGTASPIPVAQKVIRYDFLTWTVLSTCILTVACCGLLLNAMLPWCFIGILHVYLLSCLGFAEDSGP